MKNRVTRNYEVHGCDVRPFLSGVYCTGKSRARSLAGIGVDFVNGPPPRWCPLRTGPLQITLAKEKTP